MTARAKGRVLVAGRARGEALVLSERLSFWGGLDPVSGRIIDVHHPQVGAQVAGSILVLPGTRGSVSGPGTLAESIRLGTGPSAIILPAPDVAIVSAVAVTEALYERAIPVLCLEPDAYGSIRNGQALEIGEMGLLR
jgi:predicted aconitase with swiveling domain